MSARIREENNMDRVIGEFKRIAGRRIRVGVAAAENSTLGKLASANEFGAVIRPKNGQYLAIPLRPEAKGLSPRRFKDLFFVPGKSSKDSGILALPGSGGTIVPMYLLLKKTVIPERSFMRSTFTQARTRAAAKRIMNDAVRLVFNGGSGENMLNALGASLASSVRETIRSDVAPANAPLTLLTKGSGKKTLYDSGELYKRISWEIV